MNKINLSKQKDIQQINMIIDNAIQENKEIRITSYSLSDAIEKQTSLIIKSILKKYDRSDLYSTIITCTKEIITNGTKANMKNIFFNQKNLDLDIPEEYKKGILEFKQSFSKKWFVEIGFNARKLKKYVRTAIKYDKTGVQIDVYNNSPISDVDVKRIAEKLKNAEQCDNLVEYYMKFQDGTEGAGIGMALIIFSYKGANIDTRNYRLYLNSLNYLCVSLNFPFKDGYVYPIKNKDYKLVY